MHVVQGGPEIRTIGAAIHAGLEWHFPHLLETDKQAELEELLLAYDDCWKSYDAVLLNFGRSDDAESLRDLASLVVR